MKQCPVCEKLFEPHNGMQKYCSANCNRSARNDARNKHTREEINNLTTRECLVCGKEFQIKATNITKKYCCTLCRQKAERIFGTKQQIDLEYKDKIRFGGNKYTVLQRDKYECQICGNQQQLVIHHKDCSGQSDNVNNNIDNLITLCRKCHINIHKTGIVPLSLEE